MQLYKMNEQFERLIDAGELFVDTETGEVFDDKALDQLALDWDTKVTNTGCFIKDMETDIVAIKSEVDRLRERQKRLEKRVENLKGYLSFCLNGKKFHSPQVDISFRKSEQVEILEGCKIPDEYQKVKTTYTPNKTALKQAIKSGKTFDGISLVEKQNIQIK